MWFKDSYKFLSNFYDVSQHGTFIILGDLKFTTVENAYQAAKTNDLEIREKILHMKPGDSKRFARENIKKSNSWNGKSLIIMEELLRQKFKNEFLMAKLQEVKGEIIEDTHWHDNWMGNCVCERCSDIIGHNHLGKLLMKIRDNIDSPNALF